MKSIVNQQKFKELQEDLYFIHPACSEGYIRANIPALLVHIDPNPGWYIYINFVCTIKNINKYRHGKRT